MINLISTKGGSLVSAIAPVMNISKEYVYRLPEDENQSHELIIQCTGDQPFKWDTPVSSQLF